MRFPRQLLGKVVEVHWKDPVLLTGADGSRRGRGALGTWSTFGVAESVVDGVVRVVHNSGSVPGEDDPGTFDSMNIPESLIEAVWAFKAKTRVAR